MNQPTPQRPTLSQVRKWNEASKHWINRAEAVDNYTPLTPEFLFDHCWELVNHMKLPIVPLAEFWETALRVAGDENVTNGEQFQTKFKEEVTLRLAECDKSIEQAWYQTVLRKNHVCEDALEKVTAACNTRSYVDFIRVLEGTASGWKPDAVQDTDKSIDENISGEEAQLFVDDYYSGPAFDTKTESTHKGRQRKRYVLLHP
ncbi:hypothetical protein THAR02_11211 [Trichoderma harzianum]|uniref:Uncharacterized protein n=1 Tax=Trichoderma harzianum TaxID=5544 RepID=A0A0F9WW30_TRIHA|nr:hypothetical protein THAR02_11211 [Trichoderma harzianum]